MALPTNIDSTYADSGTDASVALHQQHHDSLHALYNGGDCYQSGNYNIGLYASGSTATLTLTLDRVIYRPFFVGVRRAFDRIGIYNASAAAAGGVLRLGIYSNSNGQPGSLIVDAGTVASTSTGGKEITISTTLDPGWVHLAIVPQVAAGGVLGFPTSMITPLYGGWTTPPQFLTQPCPTQSSVSGALPSTATPSWATTTAIPAVCLRAA